MAPLTEWQTLLEVEASAAATLTGLVFVAASINLGRIIATPGLPTRVSESLLQFLQVFFICTAALIPRQPMAAFAGEVLAIALVSCAYQIVGQIRYARLKTGHPRNWLVTRTVGTFLASVPLFVTSAGVFLGMPAALYWLVPGFVFSFIAGVGNTWVLLIEIIR
jgi:hypothetical protein